MVRKFNPELEVPYAVYAANDGARVIRQAQKVEAVLAESVLDTPNLLKFVPFAAAHDVSQEEQASAKSKVTSEPKVTAGNPAPSPEVTA